MNLFGSRISADVIVIVKIIYWIRVGLNPMTGIIRRGRNPQTQKYTKKKAM